MVACGLAIARRRANAKPQAANGTAMYPHRIRLRGPWECEPIDGSAPARRVTMPCRLADAGLAGRGSVRLVRKFGYPGRIDDGEHVWLTCAGSTGCTSVHINEASLAAAGAFAFEVTSLLTPRNRLEVVIDGKVEDAGLWGEVALEIRRDAYLADVQLHPTARGPLLTGLVVGVAPQPLELYTMVDGQHVDYRTIAPTPAGQPFGIELAGDASRRQMVRVELVHISAIWYIVEMSIRDWICE